MSTPKLSTLTDEEKRVLCAEHAGYKRMVPCNGVVRPDGEWIARTVRYEDAIKLIAPHYLTDLNAAITLCDVLKAEGYIPFIRAWGDSWRCDFKHPDGLKFIGIDQSLARAITNAFLKTKGLTE